MRDRTYYGAMMVETGEADALISGLTRQYPETIKPALQIIGKEDGTNRVAGMHIVLTRDQGPIFFVVTTVSFNPSSEELVEIAKKIIELSTNNYDVNLDAIRGLDYYKGGRGFEISCNELGAQKQVCGGGEYEAGVGFAVGLDRILLIN